MLFRGFKEPISGTSEKISDCQALNLFETVRGSLIRSVDKRAMLSCSKCNANGHSGVSNYYGAHSPDTHTRQCFYAAVIYGCFKIEWHGEYDIWFNGNV